MTSQSTFLSLDFYTRKVNVTNVNIALLPLLQREIGDRERERRKKGHERQKEKERERD